MSEGAPAAFSMSALMSHRTDDEASVLSDNVVDVEEVVGVVLR
jgi:hypothetical protein